MLRQSIRIGDTVVTQNADRALVDALFHNYLILLDFLEPPAGFEPATC